MSFILKLFLLITALSAALQYRSIDMAAPISKGRMIRVDIKKSKNFSSLSKEAMILFMMMIPHFSSHGKLNGSPYFIKGEIVPLISFFTVPIIEKCLKEISDSTNVKWFECNGLWYVHSIKWEEHQELRKDRLGVDDMPDYSITSPGLIPHEVEVEVEVEVKGKEEGVVVPVKPSRPATQKISDEEWLSQIKTNPAYLDIEVDREYGKMLAWCQNKKKVPSRARFLNWLNRVDVPMKADSKIMTASKGAMGGLMRAAALRKRLEEEQNGVQPLQ
ncbi:MAG: hypothetical protein HGA69_00515 [Desulfobulbaceae bacterium]|nr:hypothetical protein [Desulfobulbaceae bacterium]